MDGSLVPDLAVVISLNNQVSRWFLEDALPLWDRHGVDRRSGGYFEDLSLHRGVVEASGAVRRGRVVARQIYVFDVGHRLGWLSPVSSPVEHGCEYLFSHLHAGDGVFHTAIDAATRAPRPEFSLYEHAFYLFALAKLRATLGDRYPIDATASSCLQWLRTNLGRSEGGFNESVPPTLPLKSNPHMHLLEAAIAWVEAAAEPDRAPWISLAKELVGLCLTRFCDPRTAGIREYFDFRWQPLQGDDGRILEPGHQFEWAWLLMQWADSPYSSVAERAQCGAAAASLMDLGERWGVDPARGIAFNEIWDDMTPKDSVAKLWPQTERVKAWCAMLQRATSGQERARAARYLESAVRGMQGFLRSEAPGTWHEVCCEDGSFSVGPTKASSFYHLVCAIDVLGRTVGRHGAGGV